jgi:EmrB/QacA subfamily drug resistance transporter
MNAPAAAADAGQRNALILIALSSFITPLLLAAVNVAVPAIAEGLRVDAILLSWVPTAYLLTSAVLLLPFGRLADIYGRKRMFLIGLGIVTITSICAAAAPSVNALLAWRMLQGVGAAMLFGTGVAILSSIYPREGRGAAIGVTVSAVYFGLTLGPAIGGFAIHYFSWRSVFLIPVPFALLILAAAPRMLKGEWRETPPPKFDYPGALLYGLAIVALMAGVSLLPAREAGLLIAAGSVGLAGFVRFERGQSAPMFDVGLFYTNRLFTFSCLAALAVYSATFGTSYVLSLYLQYLNGISAPAAGLILMSQPLVMALLSPWSGKLSDVHEPRRIASFGLVLIALGLGCLSYLEPGSSTAHVLAGLMTIGLGFSLFSSPNVNAILGSVDKRQLGSASGAVSTMRVLGQMFSMGVVTVVFALAMGPVHITPASYPALMHSIQLSLLAAAGLCVLALLLSLARGTVRSS